MSANQRCVLHTLAGHPTKAGPFVYDGYSLCGSCVRGSARDVIRCGQSMSGLIRDALEEKRVP